MQPDLRSICCARARNAVSIQRAMIAGLLGCVVCGGCSVQTDAGLESIQHRASSFSDTSVGVTPETQMLDQDNGLELSGGKLISKTDMPSPGRTNAFELSDDYQPETAVQESFGKREIYVVGFVEVDNPSVMLTIDGRMQVLKAGETFEKLTVLEIAPPRARLSSDGVSWNASIFDRRSK